MRAVRKVLVLRYDGEDLLVLALTSRTRRAPRKLVSRKVLCKGGLPTGSWNDQPRAFAGRARCRRECVATQATPSRNQLVGVLKLFGPSDCSFPAGCLRMFTVRSAKSFAKVDVLPTEFFRVQLHALWAGAAEARSAYYFGNEKLRLLSWRFGCLLRILLSY